MTTPYLSVPQEQVAERLNELIEAAHTGTRVVITRDGMAYAQFWRVNPLLTERRTARSRNSSNSRASRMWTTPPGGTP
jgi:antitoxin (DNA-binding transcriptional repressor) of toxin-antitoxin stability system